jgi:hypothetical protein
MQSSFLSGHISVGKNSSFRPGVQPDQGTSDERGSEGVMSSRRLAAVAALCGIVVFGAWHAAGLLGFGSPRTENREPAIEGSVAASATAGAALISQAIATGEDTASAADVAIIEPTLPDPRPMPGPETPAVQIASAASATTGAALISQATAMGEDVASAEHVAIIDPASPDPRPIPPPETRVQLPSLFRSDPAKAYPRPAARAVEIPNECFVAEICIDDYLWSLYEQTPKVDTAKVPERINVTVKRKGKTRTVSKTVTKYVDRDFAWKDPISAQRAGMSLKDYVIGGMDRSFKLKLYRAVRAMDQAGFMPGITSAFRDDYRQSIASGKKAATAPTMAAAAAAATATALRPTS